jgi:hypothetical protein
MAHWPSRFRIFNHFSFLVALWLLSSGMHTAARTQDCTLIWRIDFSGSVGSASIPNNWSLLHGPTANVQLPLRSGQREAYRPATPSHYVKAGHDGRTNPQEVL